MVQRMVSSQSKMKTKCGKACTVLTAGAFLAALPDVESRQVPIPYMVGGALGEEVNVVLVIFELFLVLQCALTCLFLLATMDAVLLVNTLSPLVGVDVLVV